jgi:hypothetical protein
MTYAQFRTYLLENHYTAKYDFPHSGGVILGRNGEAVECFSFTPGERKGFVSEPTNIQLWTPDNL